MSQLADLNVLGSTLETCSLKPKTGFYRTGCCETGPEDFGQHTVCARVTQEFLDFSFSRGNDLIHPRPEFDFPGLKPGDRWCLSVQRWKEAFEAGVAPPVFLRATHQAALRFVSLEELRANSLDLEEVN
jgi:hypothetical protein